jgi:hypothetical protein
MDVQTQDIHGLVSAASHHFPSHPLAKRAWQQGSLRLNGLAFCTGITGHTHAAAPDGGHCRGGCGGSITSSPGRPVGCWCGVKTCWASFGSRSTPHRA